MKASLLRSSSSSGSPSSSSSEECTSGALASCTATGMNLLRSMCVSVLGPPPGSNLKVPTTVISIMYLPVRYRKHSNDVLPFSKEEVRVGVVGNGGGEEVSRKEGSLEGTCTLGDAPFVGEPLPEAVPMDVIISCWLEVLL